MWLVPTLGLLGGWREREKAREMPGVEFKRDGVKELGRMKNN